MTKITKGELKRLSSLMIDHDIKNQSDLARAVKSSRQGMNKLFNGEHEFPRLRQKVADYFSVPYGSIWKSGRTG